MHNTFLKSKTVFMTRFKKIILNLIYLLNLTDKSMLEIQIQAMVFRVYRAKHYVYNDT